MAGEIVHLEIPSRSFERSASFYAKLFGWRTDTQQAGGHLRFEIPGADAATTGSLVRSALAQATGPLPFIAVDDVDRTLAEAERQGGRVLARRVPLAGQSQYGLLADVDGNVSAVVAAGTNGKSTAPKSATADAGGGAEKKAKDDAPKSPPADKTTAGAKKPNAKKSTSAPASPAPKPATKTTTKPGPARKR